MKQLKVWLTVVLLFSFVSVVPNSTLAANKGITEAIVELKGEITDDSSDKKKETIYTPDEAKPVRVLPSTGEVLTSFMYMLLGLSFILFIFGLLLSRSVYNNYRWEY